MFSSFFSNPEYKLAEKSVVRKRIIERVYEYNDFAMVKQLFIYMVEQPNDIHSIPNLPNLDIDSLKEVIQLTLFSSSQINQTCLNSMIKLMSNDLNKDDLTSLHCEAVLRICEEHELDIVMIREGGHTHSGDIPVDVVHLSC
jgi:hypothetical protein